MPVASSYVPLTGDSLLKFFKKTTKDKQKVKTQDPKAAVRYQIYRNPTLCS